MFRLYQAIECYDKAIQINPNNAGAYNNIGLVLYDLNKYNVLSKFFLDLVNYVFTELMITKQH